MGNYLTGTYLDDSLTQKQKDIILMQDIQNAQNFMGAGTIGNGAKITSGLGKNIGKYLQNILGTKAYKTGQNILKNNEKVLETAANKYKLAEAYNVAKNGKNTIPNAIKKTAAKTRFELERAINKTARSKVNKLDKANELAIKGRNAARVGTAAGAAGAGIIAAPMLSSEFRDAGTSNGRGGSIADDNAAYVDSLRDIMTGANADDEWNAVKGNIQPGSYGTNQATVVAPVVDNAAGGWYDPTDNAQIAPIGNGKIVVANKPAGTAAVVQKTISSDPGYKDGYRIDQKDAGAMQKIAQLAANAKKVAIAPKRKGQAVHEALMGLNAGSYGSDDEYGITY